MAITPPQFLLHHDGDNVAVAMTDLQPGTLQGRSVKEGTESTAVLNHAIPLGHKFALADLADIHTHNMRSYRWEASRA
ncbi:MAG: hypothetical protein EBX11_02670 [Actinobacteria bacterium]|nr:hypothetical protein [Actinomycetota bacterium]